MQRFLVALFAVFALLAVSLPAVQAADVAQRDTNADRLRRGEPLLAPRNLRRHASRTDSAKRSTPSSGTSTPPPSGTVQCRNSTGDAIGYLTQGWTLTPRSTDGVTCNFASGVLSIIDGAVSEATSIIGAVVGAVLSVGSSATAEIVGVTTDNNAVTWGFDSATAGLNASYVNENGDAVPCHAFYNETSAKITISAAVEIEGLVSVSLYLV